MLRVGVFSLMLVAVALAADNNQNQGPQGAEDDTAILTKLKLTQAEHLKLVADGEDASADEMAYETAQGMPQNKLSCKSYIVDPSEIQFTLYSMPTKNITWTGSENVNLVPYYDPELPTQILISGRLQTEQVFQPAELAFTYAVRGRKMNVISVNWDAYSSCGYIRSIVLIVPQVADIVGNMIQKTLVGQNNMDYNKLRLTGFGFGAHVAGLAARQLPQKPARITALDPAGFLYNIVPSPWKIQKGDAKFMDTIMTNRGSLGMNDLVGDVNFLPSGGRIQKGCENLMFGKNACSHHLALEYFIESVQKGATGFVAKPANTWTDFLAQKSFTKYSEIMGEEVSQKRSGNFYLEVNAQTPYSRGINGAYLFKKASEEPIEKQPEVSQSQWHQDADQSSQNGQQ